MSDHSREIVDIAKEMDELVEGIDMVKQGADVAEVAEGSVEYAQVEEVVDGKEADGVEKEEMLERREKDGNGEKNEGGVRNVEVGVGGNRGGEESGRIRSIREILRSEVGYSKEKRFDSEGSDYGASSSTRSFLAPRSVEPRLKHICEPSTSTAPQKCCSIQNDEVEEKEEDEEEAEKSLMSSKFFEDSISDWEKIGMSSAVEKLRVVTRRPSMVFNLPHMTEDECKRLFNPADFFNPLDDSSSGSSTTTDSDSSYRRGLERHHARKRARLEFIALPKDEKRLICMGRAKRQVVKRKLEVCYRPEYDDVNFVRKMQKRRRLGEGELAEDVWEWEDRMARKRKIARRLRQGFVVDEKEPKAKKLNSYVPFDLEADRRIVEELNEDGEYLERDERQAELVGAVELGVVEVVEAAGQPLVEAEAATEDDDDDDGEMPMDRSIGSDDDMSSASSTATAIPLRRSQRVRKPIDRWTYPVDHIPSRRRVVRRKVPVQLARPVRRRPMMLPPPPPPAVVKQPRLPPVLARGLPQLPAPAAPTSLVLARKTVIFEDIDGELEKCRNKAASADFGSNGLDISIKIARISSSIRNFKAKNAVPSPAQLTRLLNGLAKIRACLGMC